MGGAHGRRLGGLALSTVMGLTALSGCQSVRFRMGGADQGGAILGLGEATPYLQGVRPDPREPIPRGPTPPLDVYAATKAGMFSPAVRPLPPRIYVTTARSGGVDVIDPSGYQVVRHIKLARTAAAQGVVPSWDLHTLWIRAGDSFVPLDPATGRIGKAVPATDPRDLLFTPDGLHALVPSGQPQQVEVRDPRTLRRQRSIDIPCKDPGHADFSADGTYAVLLCPATGRLIRLAPGSAGRAGVFQLADKAAPRDIRLSPDGSRFYVSDSAAGGVWLIDALGLRNTGFIPTGQGASALAISRGGDVLYVVSTGSAVAGRSGGQTNASLSLISLTTGRNLATWPLPRVSGATSAFDSIGVSDDGSVLWLADQSAGWVYALSALDGHLIHKVKSAARTLVLFPQPGRYSLGPTLR